jgi:hypothetical protein
MRSSEEKPAVRVARPEEKAVKPMLIAVLKGGRCTKIPLLRQPSHAAAGTGYVAANFLVAASASFMFNFQRNDSITVFE